MGKGSFVRLTISLSKLNSMPRLYKIRTSHHELRAPHITGTLNDIVKVIFMNLPAVIFSPKYRVTKVDSNLEQSSLALAIAHMRCL
jgi:hypothetical protein